MDESQRLSVFSFGDIVCSEKDRPMKVILAAAAVSAFLLSPALAHEDQGNHYGWFKAGHKYSGAPGPIAGAGLPILAIGYGVYWLVKRRRRNTD